MFKDETLASTIAENLIEVCHILENTASLVSDANYGLEQERQHLQNAITKIIATINLELMDEILQKHAALSKINARYENPTPKELENVRAPRFDLKPIERAHHLEFSDRQTAILIRQTIFNIRYLLNRSCTLYVWRSEIPELEKTLFRIRIGHTIGGSLNDILDDLFIAHPDLAICGFEEFNWSHAKEIRDED